MNTPVLKYALEPVPRPRFQDLDGVRLLRGMPTDEAAMVPAGTAGTIVGVWSEGQAFEVEFRDFEGLVTAGLKDIARSQG